MGARGPLPKSSTTRIRYAVAADAAAMPKPPAREGWLPETVDAYDTFWASNVARSVAPVDLPELFALFDLRDQRARLLQQITDDGGVTVTGSRGQPALHPSVRALAAIGGTIERLADRFGCSPAARTRLGLDAAGATGAADARAGRIAAILAGEDEG